MQQTQNHTNTPQQIRKTIGNTTYEISVHFSQSSTESAHDKLKRIIINDCISGEICLNDEKVRSHMKGILL